MKKLIALICTLCLATAALLPALAEETTGMANPWRDSTREELLANPGYSFELPADAQNVSYRLMESEGLAEISFTLDNTELTFRMQSANQFTDISGLYYTWDYQGEGTVGRCPSRLMQTKDGDSTVELLLWYDEVPGIMYSLSAAAPDLDGFDLTAVAQQMYVPAQGEADGFDFSELSDIVFEFSSGVGAWYTELIINGDGSFTGNFHDSEMGESTEAYSDGSVYGCSFHGCFSQDVTALASHTWQLKVEQLELDEGQLPEMIEDGIRYVTTDPYGITQGHNFTLYTPGIAMREVPEGCLSWLHLEGDNSNLPCYALYDAAEDVAFVGIVE